MPSPTKSAPPELPPADLKNQSPPAAPRRKVIIALVVIPIVLCCGVALYPRLSPFSEKSVSQNLSEAGDSVVTFRSFHQTYFPHPGSILEGVEFRRGPDHAEFITIEKLTIQGSYAGVLSRHVPRITAAGVHVSIPPFGSKDSFQFRPSKTVVDQIVTHEAIVEFPSAAPEKQPVRFDVHEAVFNNAHWGSALQYQLKFHNPNPPGEISVAGKFGPLSIDHPEDAPLSGEYTFEHADLEVYGGIGGLLASQGKFEGVLNHVNVAGTTDTPDFNLRASTHSVHLQTQFDGYVDAMRGDTFLNRVEGHFNRTTLIAKGSIAGRQGSKGKFTMLEFTAPKGRIEDLLDLFVTSPRAPMSGPVALNARVEIPPGHQPFLKKINLQGTFGIDDGSFSQAKTQKDVDELSAGARGESPNQEDPETVMSNLHGQVALSGGVATFSDLSFGIPGAHARMNGSYDLIGHKIDLHGKMWVDTKISKTTTGFKSLLLKIMDPIFKKKRKGEVVPVHILGTYEKPQFGLDLGAQDNQKATAK
jgi:hypothetical protein